VFTLIENGELLTPEPRGRGSVLLAGERIAKVGAVDRRALDRLGADYDVIDATDRLVAPGLIDVHEHLLGGSGESGFATQTPEIRLAEIVTAGITCVAGCLGVDTTMKTMPGLLARAKALREEGVTAHVWTGGYNVPPTTILAGVREDVMFIAEVVGAGEIAISDERSTDPDAHELARLVNDAFVGGMLSGKAGVTHFHVGERPQRLRLLRQIIDEFETSPARLYPTHVERDEALFAEAVDLAKRGATVDVDVVEKDLPKWLRRYREAGGPPERLTASSDASVTGPGNLFAQVRACVLEHGFAPADVLPLVTANPARVLKLGAKGRLEAGRDADVVVLDRASWEVREVVGGGRRLVRDGRMAVRERWEDGSERGAPHGEGAAPGSLLERGG
jgi:beta-aspartyl-dipeptidase (metallo-type)